ncbi:MAG TPA: glycosyltransferase family 2 protein [Xanthomonadaceae bacterium]|nr:glycosyltransferase family 2 protein [Xanthomonadaceae bacterium]
MRTRKLTPRPAAALESRDGAWCATGERPWFELQGAPTAPGWYLFSIRIECDSQPLRPWLVTTRHGLDEAGRIELPFAPGGGTQRIPVRIEHELLRLALHPHDAPCEFRLGELGMRRLTRTELLLRLGWPPLRQQLRSGGGLFDTAARYWRTFRAGGSAGVAEALRPGAANPAASDYGEWVRRFDTPSRADLEALAAESHAMANAPTVSILMPVFETPEPLLRRAIESVLAQVYPHWELCVADDASQQPHVAAVLRHYARLDARIRMMRRERNGHISAASNSALALATGAYVALLDHDDELPPHALYWVARWLRAHPGLQMLYSDEDKIDLSGRRFDPYFKPDWNPDLFRCQNMVSHLGVYATALVRSLGGFREGYEGSQDYDLALRCSERLAPERIGHVPRVLYHWRAVAGSTARDHAAKGYAGDAARRAMADHLARTGVQARVEIALGGYHRVRRSLPSPPPRVSLIVPTRDRLDLLRVCVDSVLARTRYPDFELIVVDNRSERAETLEWLGRIALRGQVRVVPHDAPFNFSAINNAAVAQARGEIVVLLNNDIEVISPDWLEEMVSHAVRPEIGAVGAMLYYPDGRIQHAGVVVGYMGVAGHAYQGKPRGYAGQMGRACLVQNMTAVTAACLAVRRAAYLEVGGLDEALQVAFNDVDFCLRLERAGYRNLWTPHAELYHHESATRGYEDSPEKARRFESEVGFMQRRWGDRLLHDRAYNPNLALAGEPFALDFSGEHEARILARCTAHAPAAGAVHEAETPQ